jgi:hypothetical protein
VKGYHRHPDLPRSGFIDGRLGVLQPTFARSYLVIAYRYLNAIGMDEREKEQARDYYKDRATGDWDRTGTDWTARWRSARSRYLPPPPAIHLITSGTLSYDPETHSFALNCAEDAFRVALETLNSRRRTFGASSAAFRSWLDAQDKVFANCEGGAPVTPPSAAPNLPALIRADRDYQIAAAHFYAGEDAMAIAEFRRVAQSDSSPWRMLSRYLIARTMLRSSEDGKVTPEFDQETRAILADARLRPIHGMTWNLRTIAGIRDQDQNYFLSLSRLLSSRGQGDGLREELWNYTTLYDKIIGDADPNAVFGPTPRPAADPAKFRGSDLSDWIHSFQSRDPQALTHSVERWKRTHSSAWLLSALEHAGAGEAKNERLLSAAASLPPDSPAYLTAQYHIQRLTEELGGKTAARDAIQRLLAGSAMQDLPSSINLFRGLAMLAAPDLGEFLQLAVRRPVMVTFDTNIGEEPNYFVDPQYSKEAAGEPRLDRDSIRLLNHDTPYGLLKEAALGSSVPADLRAEAAMTAFTRGLMLDEDISNVAARLAMVEPDLAGLVQAYLEETTPSVRRFAAAFLLLRRPEARPYFGSGISRQTAPGKLDPYRDNWWCPVDIPIALDSRAHQDLGATPGVLQDSTKSIVPDFLTGATATEARHEFAELSSLHAAADFLGSIVFPYAVAHPDDPRIPEALHNLVRAEHYGCNDVNTWKVARKAFQMLHLRYPKSEWTKRTPSWVMNASDFPRDGAGR